MTIASILSPIRTPAGKLKGYHLTSDNSEFQLTCAEIKAKIQEGELLVEGLTINSVGALIQAPAKPEKQTDTASASKAEHFAEPGKKTENVNSQMTADPNADDAVLVRKPVHVQTTEASIVNSVRSPAGKLKGYNLFIEGAERYLTCAEIRERLLDKTLHVEGLMLNRVGALVVFGNGSNRKAKAPVIETPARNPLHTPIASYEAAKAKAVSEGRVVAFVKRRVV